MPKMKLTDAAVKRIKPPQAGQVEYFDALLPSFGLRASFQGTRSWILFYRLHGKLRRYTLGRYPALGLADARQAARDALEQVDKGVDPAAEKKIKRREVQEQARHFEAVAETFITRYAKKKNKSWKETERIFVRYVNPYWGHRPIETIGRGDVVALLDTVEDAHGVYTANRTLAAVRKLFNWALVERALIEYTPIVPGMARAGEVKRDRVLTDAEIRAVWNAADTWPFGPFVRTLILTGQRLNEVAQMKWDELDLETGRPLWTIPAEKNKSGRTFECPLSPLAVEAIKNVPNIGPYVFMSGRRRDRPLSGFSKAKADLDEQSGVTGWRFHDLRRTVRTNLSALRVSEHVCERVLNHAQKGLDAVYNKHSYFDEKRDALNLWADRVGVVVDVNVDDDKVVKLHGT